MSDKLKFDWALKGIEILETSMHPPENPINSKTLFGFNINVEQGANIDKGLAIITISVSIYDEKNKNKLGFLKASCIYGIENLKKFHDKKSNKVIYPDQISFMLNSVSISTTRGLMFSTFKGTFLHGALLPIVDPKGLKMKQ